MGDGMKVDVGTTVDVSVATGGGSGVGVPLAVQASDAAISTTKAAMVFLCIT